MAHISGETYKMNIKEKTTYKRILNIKFKFWLIILELVNGNKVVK